MVSALSGVNTEITTSTSVDPTTCKRRDYTPGLATATLPSEMSQNWETLVHKLRDLYSKLGSHPAMSRNLDQTFSTPANSKNSVYFMWDFVGRTLHQLYLVPAKTERLSAKHKEAFRDVQGRAVYGAMLILDQPPGMLEMMVKSVPFDQADPTPAMGTEVQEAARAIAGSD